MQTLKTIAAVSAISVALAIPAAAQSVAERTMGYGDQLKLGTVDRGYSVETVAPVAGPGDYRYGNISRRGPARYYGYAEDYSYGAYSSDRTRGYGNRSKLGRY